MSMGPLFGLRAKLKTLNDRLTSVRAANLDEITATRLEKLDAAISSRAAASSYTATRAGYLDLLNTHLNADTGIMVPKFALLTSGTLWTRPAKIIGNIVNLSGIAGGEAHNSAPVEGQGGSHISMHPYTVGATETYSIGSGGTGTGGANGTNTTFGTITLIGGGATGCTGEIGFSSGVGAYGGHGLAPSSPFGSRGPNRYAGGGLRFDNTVYGYGGGITSNNGGDGAILLQWWETV